MAKYIALIPLLLTAFLASSIFARTIRVKVIYTGGTIGMVYDANEELVPGPPKDFQESIHQVAAMSLSTAQRNDLDMRVDITESSPLLDSCNIGIKEWNYMASTIARSHADAFIIIHGTDTMAYTASALSFMLHNLRKPVVITGSQIPMVTDGSDGVPNLLGAFQAVRMMALKNIHHVAVFFGGLLMKGVTVTKASAVRLDAFDNPGSLPYAVVEREVQSERSRYEYRIVFTRLIDHAAIHNPNLPLQIMPLASDVASFVITPDFSVDILSSILLQGTTRGLLLITYGANNVPSNRKDLLDVLKIFIQNGGLVVSLSHVYDKARSASEYETGNIMERIGVVNGSAMTFEAAICKMRWLLATKLDAMQIRNAMKCDFMGEYPMTSMDNKNGCAQIWNKLI